MNDIINPEEPVIEEPPFSGFYDHNGIALNVDELAALHAAGITQTTNTNGQRRMLSPAAQATYDADQQAHTDAAPQREAEDQTNARHAASITELSDVDLRFALMDVLEQNLPSVRAELQSKVQAACDATRGA